MSLKATAVSLVAHRGQEVMDNKTVGLITILMVMLLMRRVTKNDPGQLEIITAQQVILMEILCMTPVIEGHPIVVMTITCRVKRLMVIRIDLVAVRVHQLTALIVAPIQAAKPMAISRATTQSVIEGG